MEGSVVCIMSALRTERRIHVKIIKADRNSFFKVVLAKCGFILLSVIK